jgi:6-phosphogluconolactonase
VFARTSSVRATTNAGWPVGVTWGRLREVDVRILPDADAAAQAAAGSIARRLRLALTARGRASLAVSGGRTPAVMIDLLAAAPLDWREVDVFQVDERVAPDGHPDRNAALLDRFPEGTSLHPMPVTAADLPRACARYGTSLPDRLDVVHLGLGDDGHTASWPPGDPVVSSPRPVETIVEFLGRPRMTLTPVAVNRARSRVVLVTGASKADVVADWVQRGRRVDLPVAAVARRRTTLILDAEAAARVRR